MAGRKGIPLVQRKAVRNRIADAILDAAFQHDEGLVGVVVRVQARPWPGGMIEMNMVVRAAP
jgi:hypothetical protein